VAPVVSAMEEKLCGDLVSTKFTVCNGDHMFNNSTLLCLEQNLTTRTHLDATSLTVEDTIDGASSTVTEPPVALVKASIPPISWLAVHLLESGLDEVLVKDCELKLIGKEGFVSEADFAELPPSDVDAVYLKEIGISGKGVQVKIIKLHRELYAKSMPPSPPSPLVKPLTVLPVVSTTPRRSPTGNSKRQHMQKLYFNSLTLVSIYSGVNIYLRDHSD